MGLTLITAPEEEPLTSAEVKDHCRITTTADDDLVAALIVAAREHAENHLGRALITQSWKWTLDYFPCRRLKVPRAPLQSVTSVKYVDTGGTLTTINSSGYRVDLTSEPGTIEPAYDDVWPSTREVSAAVEIAYDAGYADAAAVPQGIKQGMLLLLGHWYENREGVITGTIVAELPMAVKALWGPYRIWEF